MQKLAVLLATVLALIFLGTGVIIGYFVGHRTPEVRPSRVKRSCPSSGVFSSASVKRRLGTCVADCRVGACQAESCELPEPRGYVAYHLRDKAVTVDGRIDEEAWTEVPWTEDFVDLRGLDFPKPHFETRVKLRWDDANLYVAAYLQEDDVWANKTEHDSKVYLDNAFEVYVDTDGTTHNYKEFQINALGTTWDLRLTKAYIDGGKAESSWESNATYAVYSDGEVNNPNSNNNYWSVEIALPFSRLRQNTLTPGLGAPEDNSIWRIVLARPEWGFQNVNGQYVKDGTVEASWWSWQPHGVISLHLPDRWGLVQFSRRVPRSVTFIADEQWKISQALFDTFNAMQKFRGLNGMYTTDINMLDLPQYLLTGFCVGVPEIAQIHSHTVISISSEDGAIKGHIRNDRYLWFGERSAGLK